ncbi:MAG TPA: tRNA 2-thiouridine(34) synthase MnmA [Ardenticatenaceae bacterium]|nr:tRNA 2-thiouridine(34) synthase MnmA [Ardenticatenaceae bacterium]
MTIAACEIRDWSGLKVQPAEPNGKRVVVALSGGVDSSVAALLLHEQGYQVVGVMLRLWAGEPGAADEATGFVHNRCCTPDAVDDARALCQAIGAPFYLKNLEQPFKQAVVDPFVNGYLAGQTPNPCLNCNRLVRFTHLLNLARGLGADYLATGHYVRVESRSNSAMPGGREYQLLKGVDERKDQSYVLYSLTQEKLARLLFPVGHLTKPEVRELARQYGMPLAEKAESQEICFVTGGDYRDFLRRHAPSGSIAPGPILTTEGGVLGQHEGLAFYTIGQRRGLGIAASEPLYVLDTDPSRNALIVGPSDGLDRSLVRVRDVNWIGGMAPAAPFEAEVKVRYKAPAVPATIVPLAESHVEILLRGPQRAVTPGQGCVFYDGDVCVGGGIIE